MPVDWKNQYFEMAVLSELIYTLGEVLLKIPEGSFVEIDKLTLNFR